MRLGYMPDTHAGFYDRPKPTREEVAEFYDHLMLEAELAEEAGFDALLVPERHMRSETFYPNPFLLLSAFAARTSTIRLGHYINLPPLYNPMHVAEMGALLDVTSRGRYIYGAASGYHPAYHQLFNVPYSERGARFDEAMDVIYKAWSGERFSHHGRFYHYDDVELTPLPWQHPRPETWIGGMFPKTIERAGRLGDAWCSDPFPLDPTVWNQQVQLYREAAARHGNRSMVVLMRDGWVAPTREEADAIFAPIGLREWLFYFKYGILTHHPDFQTEADFTIENARKHFVCGPPEECIKQIKMYEDEYDVDYIVMRFRLPAGPDRDKVLDCIKLFGQEVIPAFHKAQAVGA